MGKGFVNVSGRGGSEEKLTAHLEDKNNPHEVTAEQVGAAKADHTHTAAQVGARPNTWTPKLQDVAYLGENPVKSTADDTTDRWYRIGSGYAWYSAGGLLNDQPAQYGFLLNYVNGSDVFQIWNTQSNGPMYTRSGNASGWGGSWKRYYTEGEVNNLLAAKQNASTAITTGNIGSQTVNKAKYASITAPGTASLKNIKAGTSDLTAGSSALTTGDIYLVYE